MNRRNLVYTLLLNVFVSACVTGTILFWYDRNSRAVSQPVAAVESGAVNTPASPQAAEVPVKISSVVGAGVTESEIVVVKYEGDDQLDLTSWQLKDEDGNTFKFPNLILFPNGAVQVHTGTGADTVIDLYWGVRDAVWSSGEKASLYDPQGNLHAVYKVP